MPVAFIPCVIIAYVLIMLCTLTVGYKSHVLMQLRSYGTATKVLNSHL